MIGFEFWRQKSIEYVCHYVMDTLMASFLPILILISTCQHSKKRESSLCYRRSSRDISATFSDIWQFSYLFFQEKPRERKKKSIVSGHKIVEKNSRKKEQFFIIWLLAAAFCLILPKRKSNFLFLHFFFHSFYSPFPLHF